MRSDGIVSASVRIKMGRDRVRTRGDRIRVARDRIDANMARMRANSVCIAMAKVRAFCMI